MPPYESDASDWLIELAVPPQGYAVILAEAYVDESGTHSGSPAMAVAGYLFKREQAGRFSRDWQKVLDRYGLPAAHQTDCALGKGDYEKAGMDLEDRIQAGKSLIQNIKNRTMFGFGVSLDRAMYERIVGRENNAPSAYSFCLMGCMTIIKRWITRTEFEGQIAYVFEAGHEKQSEADRYIAGAVLSSDKAKIQHRYVSHNFIDKKVAVPLQAADMLAWQYHHYLKRKIEDGIDQPRKDFVALIRDKDMAIEHNEESVTRFRDQIVNEGWLVGRY